MPTLSVAETAAVLGEVGLPLVARGVIIRRPKVVSLLERVDADARATERLRSLQDSYGPGPVQLALPGRDFAVILSAPDARRVLRDSPEPFAPANREKRAALARFQPHGALISHGPQRAERRRFNEAVLDDGRPLHHLAGPFVAKAVEETTILADEVRRSGRLTWDDYVVAWFRIVRRIVLGDAGRDDHAVTDMLARLRASGNWSMLARRHRSLRARFLRQVQGHLDRAEPASLAAVVADTPADPDTEPTQQVPQWLFAYDAVAWASFRALALLHAHRDQLTRARDEVAGVDLAAPHDLPFLRACMLESLRLYPTTPAILRDTTTETAWSTGTLPSGAGVLVFAPLFHRDERVLPHAHRFAPETWAGRTGERVGELGDDDWPLVPFSAGPVVCPGRHLVLLTATTVLAALLDRTYLVLETGRDLDRPPLPSVLSPFQLRFATA